MTKKLAEAETEILTAKADLEAAKTHLTLEIASAQAAKEAAQAGITQIAAGCPQSPVYYPPTPFSHRPIPPDRHKSPVCHRPVKSYWDDSVGSPIIMKLNPDMLPIMIAAVGNTSMTDAEVSEMTQNVVLPELESIEGVASG